MSKTTITGYLTSAEPEALSFFKRSRIFKQVVIIMKTEGMGMLKVAQV